MKQISKTKGISLIVLVITIIIIIILAGVVILSLSNSNVIAKAKEAKESNDFNTIKEAVKMEESNSMFQGGISDYSRIVPEEYRNDIMISDLGEIFLKPNANTKISDIGNALDKLGAAFIPDGFTHIAGTLEDGMVIQDSNGNEFVWIPVPDITQFYLVGNFNTFAENVSDTTNYISTITTDPDSEGYKMKESVNKYKGFYIARYEAGNVSGSVVSKPGTAVYNNIIFDDSKTAAQSMYTEASATTVGKPISTLIYGEQWDAAMRYMKEVPNITNTSKKYITDSTGMGVYNSSVVNTSGSNPAYKVKNIYDMAGNVYEWTMEGYYASYFAIRGGAYFGYGSAYSATFRSSPDPDGSFEGIGFRTALYIK